MRVITDGEGEYAIAKYYGTFTKLKDLNGKSWYFADSPFTESCWGNRDKVRKVYNSLKKRKIRTVSEAELNLP